MCHSFWILILLVCVVKNGCSRIKIERNGYKNVLIALPENAEAEEQPKIVRNIEDMLRSSSVLLQMATKGRAHLSEVTFLVPHHWQPIDGEPAWKSTSFNATTFSAPRAVLTADDADVVITDVGQYPYVLHQGGCGQRAMRIVFPKHFLDFKGEKGTEFLRLWSEYKYGVFPEGGFQGDEMYPATYRRPDVQEEKTTGCSDKTFWSSSLCAENDKKCIDSSFTSSVMDQHLTSSATLYCEGDVSLGPRHDSESPSKHNLLCKEEGTWFTVMKSSDFARGRNAAPKYLQRATDVSFRFVREAASPRVIVAVEISARMKREKRFILAKASFYQFVYSTLPYGSEVTLFTFGGDEGVNIAKEATILKNEESRILYVESQPLPEEPSNIEYVPLTQLFQEIFQVIEGPNNTRKATPHIVIITSESHLNASSYEEIKRKFLNTESRLHAMLFPGYETNSGNLQSLQDLCQETGGELISLHSDPLGDLIRGFGKSIGSFNKEILIVQDYLKEDDDVDLEISFVVDESLKDNLKVSLIFPYEDTDQLQYKKAILQTPSGHFLNFMRLEFLYAWGIDWPKPEAGEYILKTRRKEDMSTPILITVAGTPSSSELPITLKVWAENVFNSEVLPRPVRIYAEVRNGWNPIRGATVIASVHHPDGEESQLVLLDDGLGDVDITKGDGIYGRYFTNFTSPGFYNVYVKAFRGLNVTKAAEGPSGFCCGSSFSSFAVYSVGKFLREAGPFTFNVPYPKIGLHEDKYSPSRVTSLRMDSRYDRICILRWTAVGDDYDMGSAVAYELKIFRDVAVIRHRFSDSGQELFHEVIQAPPEATYGKILNHAFELPDTLKPGIYHIAMRAIDDAGNAGESSNIVPVMIERSSERFINCDTEGDKCDDSSGCKELPMAAPLEGNSAIRDFSHILILVFVQTFAFIFL